MEVYEKLLKNINFTVVIWEKGDDVKCMYSNEKNTEVRQGTKLEEYVKNDSALKFKYEKLFTSKEDQNMTTEKEEICLYSLTDKVFYEIKTDLRLKYDPNILSFVSCQIRNPLTSIIGALSLIYETSLTKEQVHLINMIEKSSFDIISLSNDIVDIINIGQGKIKVIPEYVELEKCLKETKEIVDPYIQAKNLSLTIKLGEGVPKSIIIDKKRLIQILVNLITFSVKNTEIGSIVVEVIPFKKDYITASDNYPGEYIESKDSTHNILFKIKDSSNGLEEETAHCLETILGLKTHKKVKSYCNYEFGLIISKYLCNLMRGHVWFKNSPGFGTTYNFNIIGTEIK